MVNYKDETKVINLNHYRNVQKERADGIKNKDVLLEERKTGKVTDGLTGIEYEVISSFELVPQFTVINVDFKLKE
jgi:hypothetical protein